MFDFDDVFERILQVFLIIFLGILLLLVIGLTISLFKRDILKSDSKDEQIKILKQSLNEQIEEKQVYMNLLEERSKKDMSTSVDLYKLNYKEFVDELMKNPKINNRELLEKIILEFGNKVGEDLIILENEFWEDGICTWNMFEMIQEVFELEDLEDDEYISDVFYELRKTLIGYKEIDEAYENLGLERSDT